MGSNMSKVWKHFLKSLMWPAGIIAYILAVAFFGTQIERQIHGGGALVISMFIVLPTLGWIVIDMWRDAKEKVERENKLTKRNTQ
jgi:hypothetical protein